MLPLLMPLLCYCFVVEENGMGTEIHCDGESVIVGLTRVVYSFLFGVLAVHCFLIVVMTL